MAGVIDAKSGDRVMVTDVGDREAPVYLAVFDCDNVAFGTATAALTAEEATEVCRALADAVLAIAETT